MAKKINLKAEKAKRNQAYALQFKKKKARFRSAEPTWKPEPASQPAGHEATCAACNVETTVPFKPTQGRPVLCRGCFQKAA